MFILVVILAAIMVVIGLLRPPLSFTIPALAAFIIATTVPTLIFGIGDYSSLPYLMLSLIGLPAGWGLSIILLRFNVDISLRRSRNKAMRNRSVGELKAKDLEVAISQVVDSWRVQVSQDYHAERVEFYEGWGDALLRIGKYNVTLKDSLKLMDGEARELIKLHQYIDKSISLGFTMEPQEKRRGKISEGRIIYMDPIELGTLLSTNLPRLRQILMEFDKAMDMLINEAASYVGNSPVMIIYRNGIPRRIIVLSNASTI